MQKLCGLCERPISDRMLCAGCASDLAGHLVALPALFEQLEEFLLPPRRGGDRGSQRVWAPAPLDLDVVDLRTEMAATLTSWHGALYDALEWDPPAPVAALGGRVKAAAEALFINRLWITENWPAAGDCAGEVRDLFRSAESVVGPREQGTRLGNCPTMDENGAHCGAVLRLPPGGTLVACRWCGASWGPDRWTALRSAQGKFEASNAA